MLPYGLDTVSRVPTTSQGRPEKNALSSAAPPAVGPGVQRGPGRCQTLGKELYVKDVDVVIQVIILHY